MTINFSAHTRRRMRSHHISEADVEQVLLSFHTSYPAERLPNDRIGATVFIGTMERSRDAR